MNPGGRAAYPGQPGGPGIAGVTWRKNPGAGRLDGNRFSYQRRIRAPYQTPYQASISAAMRRRPAPSGFQPIPPVPPPAANRMAPQGAHRGHRADRPGRAVPARSVGYLHRPLFEFSWPVLLIGLGVWLIVRRLGDSQGGPNEPLYPDSPPSRPRISTVDRLLALLHPRALSIASGICSGRCCSFCWECMMLAERAALAAEDGYPACRRPRLSGRSRSEWGNWRPALSWRTDRDRPAAIARLRKDPDGGHHEQRTSEYTSGRRTAPVSALRSKDPVASLPRAAEGSMARTTRCLEGPALRLEGGLRRCLRPARSLHRRPRHSDLHWRRGLAGCQRPPQRPFWAWYGRWWPLVLIVAGLGCWGSGR